MRSEPIIWRGHKLVFDGVVFGRSIAAGFINVSQNSDDTWGACINVGVLYGYCEVATASHDALETALVALKAEIPRHEALTQEAFP